MKNNMKILIWRYKLDDFYNNIIKKHIAIPTKVISIKNQKDAFEEMKVSI